jgi:hypothetical protein
MEGINSRSAVVPHRGVIAIHASKVIKPEYQLAAMSEPIKSILQKEGYESWKDLPTGALPGTVELKDVFVTNFVVVKPEAIPEWKPPDKPCPDLRIITEQVFRLGDYWPGRFAWKLTNVRQISPFSYRALASSHSVTQLLKSRKLSRSASDSRRLPRIFGRSVQNRTKRASIVSPPGIRAFCRLLARAPRRAFRLFLRIRDSPFAGRALGLQSFRADGQDGLANVRTLDFSNQRKSDDRRTARLFACSEFPSGRCFLGGH